MYCPQWLQFRSTHAYCNRGYQLDLAFYLFYLHNCNTCIWSLSLLYPSKKYINEWMNDFLTSRHMYKTWQQANFGPCCSNQHCLCSSSHCYGDRYYWCPTNTWYCIPLMDPQAWHTINLLVLYTPSVSSNLQFFFFLTWLTYASR